MADQSTNPSTVIDALELPDLGQAKRLLSSSSRVAARPAGWGVLRRRESAFVLVGTDAPLAEVLTAISTSSPTMSR